MRPTDPPPPPIHSGRVFHNRVTSPFAIRVHGRMPGFRHAGAALCRNSFVTNRSTLQETQQNVHKQNHKPEEQEAFGPQWCVASHIRQKSSLLQVPEVQLFFKCSPCMRITNLPRHRLCKQIPFRGRPYCYCHLVFWRPLLRLSTRL